MSDFFQSTQPIILSCSPHVGPCLRKETEALGFEVKSESFTAIETHGTLEDAIKLNLNLHTVNHVYLLIKKFIAHEMEQVYEEVKKIAWEEIILPDGYFSIHSVSDHPSVENTMFLNLKVKDAIADRFKEKTGKRPDSGSEKNKAVIFIFWKNNEAAIYIDTTGEPLTKHGYRMISLKAPLMESLAAAMILSTRWDRNSAFINPMCGSGTLAIEAALLASNKPPGLIRKNFGFMHVLGYPPAFYEKMVAELKAKVKASLPFKIIASDEDGGALNAARTNAQYAEVVHLIDFVKADFAATPVPDPPGAVMFNPPYGERLGATPLLENIYKGIGDFMKKSCRGYWGYVFTGNLELAGKIGLKAKRRIDFLNGQLKCKLLEYELYEGSRKRKGGEGNDVIDTTGITGL